jgi:hypothetical protein
MEQRYRLSEYAFICAPWRPSRSPCQGIEVDTRGDACSNDDLIAPGFRAYPLPLPPVDPLLRRGRHP